MIHNIIIILKSALVSSLYGQTNEIFIKLIATCILFMLLASDAPIHLGRASQDECTGVLLQCQKCERFPSATIEAREDATFVAVIGPAANPRGYTPITSM